MNSTMFWIIWFGIGIVFAVVEYRGDNVIYVSTLFKYMGIICLGLILPCMCIFMGLVIVLFDVCDLARRKNSKPIYSKTKHG